MRMMHLRRFSIQVYAILLEEAESIRPIACITKGLSVASAHTGRERAAPCCYGPDIEGSQAVIDQAADPGRWETTRLTCRGQMLDNGSGCCLYQAQHLL
jgi:hypothetical protein